MCVYIALMDGEDESLSGQRLFKDPRWRIAEISWVLGVRKPKKNISNNPCIPTCCLRGFQEKSSSLLQKQTLAYSVVTHDWIFKRHRVLWSDETKKIAFGQ